MTGHDILNLGCGEKQRGDALNVDAVPAVDPDEVMDLEETPWPWDNESFNLIIMEHVLEHLSDPEAALRECERVLRRGGKVEAVLPIGVNAMADPDHETVWTWQTPDFYCGERHWDTDVGLEVKSKDASVHSHLEGPLGHVEEAVAALQMRLYGPGEWCVSLPSASGELTVVFEKP